MRNAFPPLVQPGLPYYTHTNTPDYGKESFLKIKGRDKYANTVNTKYKLILLWTWNPQNT